MGLAASQARLLSLTARIHDVEYQAQMIQNAKLQLATQEDEVYRKYNEALDAQTLTFNTKNGVVSANFNNLFGIESVTNGVNKNYVLRDQYDTLFVPDDIFDKYHELAGDYGVLDPYVFAMHMVTGESTENITNAENDFVESLANSDNSTFAEKKKEIEDLISNKIYGIYKKYTPGENDDSKDANINEMKQLALAGNWGNFFERFFGTYELTKDENDDLDTLKASIEQYRHQVFNKKGEQIFKKIQGEDDDSFNNAEFNYYLRYAMLIAEAEGIGYCSKPSDTAYGQFANDPNVLNDGLMSGRYTLEVVNIDSKTGKLTDETTSVASDSYLAYTNTSEIDKKALAKAEAEYEHAMKKIDKKDKQYDMDLNRLETERTALTTEYESVKKVIQDNVERTFGIFS